MVSASSVLKITFDYINIGLLPSPVSEDMLQMVREVLSNAILLYLRIILKQFHWSRPNFSPFSRTARGFNSDQHEPWAMAGSFIHLYWKAVTGGLPVRLGKTYKGMFPEAALSPTMAKRERGKCGDLSFFSFCPPGLLAASVGWFRWRKLFPSPQHCLPDLISSVQKLFFLHQ